MPSVEQKRAYRKKYRDANKQSINEKKKEKFVCECGGRYTKVHEKRHRTTHKHLNYINNNN